MCWLILRRFCIFVLFTFSALLLTSPLSCLARFIVLWDIRNLSIIDCEQNLTTIADSKLGSWENVDDDWGFIQIGCFYVKEPVLVIKWWGGQRRGGVLRRWWRLEIALRWKFIMDVVIIIVNIVIITIPTFALGLFSSFQPLLLLPLCTRASWTGNLENMVSAMFWKYWKKRSGGKNQEECLKEKSRLNKSNRT